MGGGLTGETLGPRALNRALLARQGLLERTAAPVPDVVARLCGLQAQVPSNPYVALWARIAGFRPEALSELLEARALARAQTLRATIHLHTADDLRALQPLTGDVLARLFRGQFRRLMGDDAAEDVAAFGRSLLNAGNDGATDTPSLEFRVQLEVAKEDADAGFAAWRDLLSAKSPVEAFDISAKYWRGRLETRIAQAQSGKPMLVFVGHEL